MKKIALLLLLIVLLVACGTSIENASNDDIVGCTNMGNFYRCIDEDYGIVCYLNFWGGRPALSCLYLRE